MSIGNYTDNFSIPLSNFDTPTWVDEDWARWRMLDALVAAVDQQDVPIVVATGAANAFVATYSPAIDAYELGLVLSFVANEAVTGASTINVNGLGVKSLKMNGEDTAIGDIPDNSYVKVIYDGTNFSVIAPKKPVNANQNIIKGDSGGTPNAESDFYVESTGPTYVELLGPNASTQGYMFSRVDTSYAGGMKYDHVNDLIILRVNGADVWTLDENGEVTATNFVGAFQGALTGNAATAARWQTSRTLTLGTDASGSVAITGAADFTLNLTIVNNAITNAKLADVPTQTFKGRTTAGTGDPEDLTLTQVRALIPAVTGDGGSGGEKGLVPAPAAGDGADDKVLHADGTWKKQKVFAYAVINGSTGALVKGFNIATASGGSGVFDLTFTDAAADANYCVEVNGQNDRTVGGVIGFMDNDTAPTTSGFTVCTMIATIGPSISVASPTLVFVTVYQ